MAAEMSIYILALLLAGVVIGIFVVVLVISNFINEWNSVDFIKLIVTVLLCTPFILGFWLALLWVTAQIVGN